MYKKNLPLNNLPELICHKTQTNKNFFFITQRVKARAIPCPHQPPTRGDNTVSVGQ